MKVSQLHIHSFTGHSFTHSQFYAFKVLQITVSHITVLQITVYTFSFTHHSFTHLQCNKPQFYNSQSSTSKFSSNKSPTNNYTSATLKPSVCNKPFVFACQLRVYQVFSLTNSFFVFKNDIQIESIWAPTIHQRCLNSTTGGEPWRSTVTVTTEKAFKIYFLSVDITYVSTSKKLPQTFHSIASLTHALSLGVNLNKWPITLINWRD